MKNPTDEFAGWLAKTVIAVVAFIAIVVLAAAVWIFGVAVRTASTAIIRKLGHGEGIAAGDEGGLRATGACVGAAVGLLCASTLAVGLQIPAVTVVIVPLVAALLGALVVTENFDPWRALPQGRMVDDWRDERDDR